MQIRADIALFAVRLLHTVIWAFFAAVILAIPVVAWQKRFGLVFGLVGIVFVEIVILALNKWTCPLTPWAARYTDDRNSSFDIYLPDWLARHNKEIFGTLFFAAVLFAVVRWILVQASR